MYVPLKGPITNTLSRRKEHEEGGVTASHMMYIKEQVEVFDKWSLSKDL